MASQTKPLESLLDPLGTSPSLVLFRYDLASSFVPVLRQVVEDALACHTHVVFGCLLLPPSSYVDILSSPLLHLCDFSGFVPGYSEQEVDVLAELEARISSIGKDSILLVVDSPDTLLADFGSQSRTLDSLSRVFGRIVQQSNTSRLVLPIRSNSPLLPSLLSTTFQARVPSAEGSQPHTLSHLIFHPPILFAHLVQHYHVSLPPLNVPPDASSARFWSVFVPVAGRGTGEQLVTGADNDQLGGTSISNNQWARRGSGTGVIELVTRARTGGQKGVRRVLKGWRVDKGLGRVVWCGWEEIPALKSYISSTTEAAPVSNTIESVSFNLQLSDAQQQARANVPLPYVNDGLQAYGSAQDGEIHYIPDQADDFDDDDPDDDLYI
ncbi:hypothetical protein FS749_006644 [Ceratobasidium sp. UAMH 11750]|nr:hypothetical protein FS749_006644 [Ceratobasidium sp. UAMH 11750]